MTVDMMRGNSYMGVLRQAFIYSVIVAVFVTGAFFSTDLYAVTDSTVTSKTEGGLHTVTVDTQEGKIRLYLPDDMSAGDTISGTVIAEPLGADTQEKQENSDELNGYVVDIETQGKELEETKVSQGELEGVLIPPGLDGPVKVRVVDNEGKEIAATDLPVMDTPHPMQYPDKPSPSDFKLPQIGLAGEPLQIIGPFDGKFDTSVVKVGGKRTDLLAESPRKIITRAPGDVTGPTNIEVTERGISVKGDFYNVDSNKPSEVKTVQGMWETESGKSSWRITQNLQSINAYSVKVSQEDQIRGYKQGVNIVKARLSGELIHGRVQQYFTIPIEQCMAMCPAQCEQWNDIKLVVSEDGKRLKGQIQEKALDTKSCIVVEFGWIPWSMVNVPVK